MLFLVRHAEPVNHHEWDGDDNTRPLSDNGKRQAAEAGAMLAGCGATEIRTAPHRRCVETAEIIGAVLGLTPVVDRRLHIAKSFDIAEGEHTAIWLAHSNNIPGALMRAGVNRYDCGHASIWRVEFSPDGTVTADYQEPRA